MSSAVNSSPIWAPSASRVTKANVTALARRLEEQHGVALPDYTALHRFSIERMDDFWSAFWAFSGVIGDRGDGPALREGRTMREARWFGEARLNFAENLLCERSGVVASFWNETGLVRRLGMAELRAEVARVAEVLRCQGVGPGDRVAAYMPNIPEAMIGMLATASLGAIWSVCSTDLAAEAVLARFGQIRPRVLLVAGGALYGGRRHDARLKALCILESLPSVVYALRVDYGCGDEAIAAWDALPEWPVARPGALVPKLVFERFGFDHPLYILFTSGTTGSPKCIVHGAGGTLLKHRADHDLQFDVHPGDVMFRVTGSGWMLWNSLMSGLASRATIVLYDGSPVYRDAMVLDIAAAERVTLLGLAPPVIEHWARQGLHPARSHDLSALASIGAGGSPLSAGTARYVHSQVKRDVHLSSPSGGTDIISFFVGGHVTSPSHAGQIQGPALGMAVDVFDDEGRPLRGEPGELVCTRPFPSMPVGFWGDHDGSRMHLAYFDHFPGVWRHGDLACFTPEGGIVILGRSDATLKANGVRIGTAEIYATLVAIPEILECAAVEQQHAAGSRIVLFVVLDGTALAPALEQKIRATIGSGASPRHVPERIYAVPELPRTSNGKVSEMAIRAALHGKEVRHADSLANPHALAIVQAFQVPAGPLRGGPDGNPGDTHA